MPTQTDIKTAVRAFLVANALGGKDNGELRDDTELIDSRMMDSIVALKLVNHLEETFNVTFEAHEVDQENLRSIDVIAAFVESKMK